MEYESGKSTSKFRETRQSLPTPDPVKNPFVTLCQKLYQIQKFKCHFLT